MQPVLELAHGARNGRAQDIRIERSLAASDNCFTVQCVDMAIEIIRTGLFVAKLGEKTTYEIVEQGCVGGVLCDRQGVKRIP